MLVGDVTKQTISKGKKTTEVVYKTFLGKHAGKDRYSSKTRHEKN